jgi:hypothetical protein
LGIFIIILITTKIYQAHFDQSCSNHLFVLYRIQLSQNNAMKLAFLEPILQLGKPRHMETRELHPVTLS